MANHTKKTAPRSVLEPKRAKKTRAKLIPILLYVVLYAGCVVAGVLSASSAVYRLEVGEICEQTITAPYDFVDEYSTTLQREEVMQKVPPVYSRDEDAVAQTISTIEGVFASLENTRVSAKQMYIAMVADVTNTFVPANVNWEAVFSAEDLRSLQNALPDYMTEQDIYTVASMTQDEMVELKNAVIEDTRAMFETGVTTDELGALVESALANAAYSSTQKDLVEEILLNVVQPNLIYNAEATEEARQAAAAEVQEITYKKGENIVYKGERISQSQYEIISQLGLLANSNVDLKTWVGSLLTVGVLFGVWFMYIALGDRTLLTSTKDAFSAFLMAAVAILLVLASKKLNAFIVPVYLAAILSTVMMKPASSLVYSVFISMLSAFVFTQTEGFFFTEQTLVFLLPSILGSLAAVLFLRKKLHRSEYILAGILAGCCGMLTNIAYCLLEGNAVSQALINGVIGLASGLICGLLSVGILPIWESIFSLDTPSKLLEIANPGNELLKRLMLSAPGTYHHSIMTANLAEAGAQAIGANELLVRVGAYYHDIGKLANPMMFAENQMHVRNPHDDLPPEKSAEIIINHVESGKLFAERYKLPAAVVDMITQHHGDTLVGYFYFQAKQKGEPDEKQFRYPGPKPQTKEAGILMLADTVEAATRANSKVVNPADIAVEIKKLVRGKIDDGQLDECPLTRRDITQITRAFLEVFNRSNHERVIYPEEDEV